MASHFRLYNTIKVLIYLSLVSSSAISICHCNDMWKQIGEPVDTSHWIDPHDMGLPYNEKTTYPEVTPKSAEVTVTSSNKNLEEHNVLDSKKENEDVRLKADVPDPGPQPSNKGLQSKSSDVVLKKPLIPIERTFYLRFVMNLLKKVSVNNVSGTIDDAYVHRFTSEIHLMHWQVQALEKLTKSNDKEFLGLLHQADTILNEMFSSFKSTEQKTWRSVLSEYIELSPETPITVANLFGFLTVAFVFVKFWSNRSLFSLLYTLFVVSVIWKWHHLVKEREVEKYNLLITKKPMEDPCQSATYSFLGLFDSSDKNCLEYHKAAHIDAFWEVNPLDAVSETLTLVIVRPLGPLGEHLGKFFQRFSRELSWYLYLPTILILMVILLVGGIHLMLMLFGYELHLPFFGGLIRPSPRSGTNVITDRREQTFSPLRPPRYKTMGYLKKSHIHRRRETKPMSLT